MFTFDGASTFFTFYNDADTYFFIDALHFSIFQFVPLKNYSYSDIPDSALSKLKKTCWTLKKAHDAFKLTFDPHNYRSFSLLRAKC